MEVDNIERLRAMVLERDDVRNQYNNAIAAFIQPTTLTAMFELFELQSEAVEWSAIDIMDEALIVIVRLTYTTNDNTPEFLKMMDLISNASPSARTRTLRIGLPLSLVFGSKEDIQQYLIKSAQKMLNGREPTAVDDQLDFDPGALSPEQLRQLMLYQTMQKAGDK